MPSRQAGGKRVTEYTRPDKKDTHLVFAVYQSRNAPNPNILYDDLDRSRLEGLITSSRRGIVVYLMRFLKTHYHEKLDAMTIYGKEGNAGVKKVIDSLSKIDPENRSNRFMIFMLNANIFLVGKSLSYSYLKYIRTGFTCSSLFFWDLLHLFF